MEREGQIEWLCVCSVGRTSDESTKRWIKRDERRREEVVDKLLSGECVRPISKSRVDGNGSNQKARGKKPRKRRARRTVMANVE
jgi:hypothetical protein